jgi:hypothetical protein
MGYVPRLELPNGDGMTAPRGGYGGGGGSDREWEVRTDLSGDWNMRRVYNYFAEQIEDQDWERDARVIGDSMASGSWTKVVDEDVELIGSLTVLMTGEDAYSLMFRLVRTGQPEAGAVGRLGPPLNDPALGIRGIPQGFVSPIGADSVVRDPR